MVGRRTWWRAGAISDAVILWCVCVHTTSWLLHAAGTEALTVPDWSGLPVMCKVCAAIAQAVCAIYLAALLLCVLNLRMLSKCWTCSSLPRIACKNSALSMFSVLSQPGPPTLCAAGSGA